MTKPTNTEEEQRKRNNNAVIRNNNLKKTPAAKNNGKRGKVIGISSDGHGVPLCDNCPSLSINWIGRMRVPWCNKNNCALISYFELARKCEKCRRDTEMLPKKN